jgi:CrcB protein
MTFAWVVVGAAVGAPARYAVSRGLNRLRGFPWGTLAVNVSGSFVLGVVLGHVAASEAGPARGWQVGVVAFCGAFTTYSAFAVESVELDRVRALLYTAVTIAGALGAGALGWLLGAS